MQLLFINIANFQLFALNTVNLCNIHWFFENILIEVACNLVFLIGLLLAMAFYTLVDRKGMAAIQRRRGPNVVGFFGLLQPFADGFKLFLKEIIIPSQSNKVLYLLAPILTLSLALIHWIVIPLHFENHYVLNLSLFMTSFLDFDLSILYTFLISGLGIYGILLSGWSANSKYGYLASLRSAAQLISYEVSFGFVLLSIPLFAHSYNYINIIEFQHYTSWFFFSLLPVFFIFCINILAETNRTPFDLPEAEAELVAGYNLEYSGMGFALFFLGEYINMLLMCILGVIFFFSGPVPLFGAVLDTFVNSGLLSLILKTYLFILFFVFIRGLLPRYRYDQLMNLGWKVFLPLSLGLIFFFSTEIIIFN